MAMFGLDENGDFDISTIKTDINELMQKIHLALTTLKGECIYDADFGIDYISYIRSFRFDKDKLLLLLSGEIQRALLNIDGITAVGNIDYLDIRSTEDNKEEDLIIGVEINYELDGITDTTLIEVFYHA